jgi:hypothetical protein
MGCAPTSKKVEEIYDSPIIVDVQYDESRDFSSYKTWTWLPNAGALALQSMDMSRIDTETKAAISGRLFELGYRQDKTAPDLFINYFASAERIDEDYIEEKFEGFYEPGYHMELPESEQKKKQKRSWVEGTLFIFVFDTKTKETVWYGSAQAEVTAEMPDNMKNKRLAKAIKMMMADFPKSANE